MDAPRRAIFQSRDAEPGAFLLIEHSEPVPDEAGRAAWSVQRSTGPTADGPWTLLVEQNFIVSAAGEIALAGETNHQEKVGLAFTPALVVLPAYLPAEFSQDTRLRVWPLHNPRQTKAQGAVRQTIVRRSGVSVDTPAGGASQEAIELTQTFEADLAPASVRNITRQWFVPGLGLIAEEREERTKVLGVQTRLNRESWALISSPDQP